MPNRIENNLPALRASRGISAVTLAEQAGVSRQTIYAMEAGHYIPNTLVALRLARALDVKVEDLFQIEVSASVPAKLESVEMLPGLSARGQPVRLCRVGKRVIGIPSAMTLNYFPPVDGTLVGASKVELLHDIGGPHRLLIAGCDPALSVFTRHLQNSGTDLVLANCASSQALRLLKRGRVHVAGSHLRDEKTGESNLPAVRKLFPKRAVTVVTFASFEEGLVFAKSNAKSIRGVADLARKGMRIVNRERGSGSRLLLDNQLQRLGIPASQVKGYDRIAAGHLAAAWQVHSGLVDCCIATQAAARAFGLGFLSLLIERYDLVIRREFTELPAVQQMLDLLQRASLRRELDALNGYDTSATGATLL